MDEKSYKSCKETAATIKEYVRTSVDELVNAGNHAPKLVTIMVGNNPASEVYVRNKEKACKECGIQATTYHLNAEGVTKEDVIEHIQTLNADEDVDGILLQLPLPAGMDVDYITSFIDPMKDVDCLTPHNTGVLDTDYYHTLPATPLGIIEWLADNKIDTKGKNVAIMGRSRIVGAPMARLMMCKGWGDANVSVIHSQTPTEYAEMVLKEADIIIVAVGKPGALVSHCVKPGAIVIDVGINRVSDETKKSGYKLVGDANYDYIAPKCGYITPVPGGVGLLTVAALMENILRCYKQRITV